jgi:3-dehydroquinate synthase II
MTKKVIVDMTDDPEMKGISTLYSMGVRNILVKRRQELSQEVNQLALDEVSLVTIGRNDDMERVRQAIDRNLKYVVVRCEDWKIIPLENLIAELSGKGQELYFYADSREDVEYAFSILERGVDGIVVSRDMAELALAAARRLERLRLSMREAEIVAVEDAGDGERVCVDTTSLLSVGEGLLVGSYSDFFFLVNSETVESSFVPPRPFRVNAGAVHSYVLSEISRTKYLSELSANSRVLAVSRDGVARPVTVGRVKIERRPLIHIRASVGDRSGSLMVQRAETVRLISAEGRPVSVTSLRKHDRVLVYTTEKAGRHLGSEYSEFIVER